MKWSEKNDLIAPALVAASAAIKNMFPDAKGHGYSYIPLETIIDNIKPICHGHGLAFVQGPSVVDDGISVVTQILHTSGQYLQVESKIRRLPESKSMNAAQADGAGITYLRRYQLAAIFGIAADKDIDAATPETKQAPEDAKKTAELIKAFDDDLKTLGLSEEDMKATKDAFNSKRTFEEKEQFYYKVMSKSMVLKISEDKRGEWEEKYKSAKDYKEFYKAAKDEVYHDKF